MRRAFWAVLIIAVIVVLDIVMANLPGPVPSSGAISNVESSTSFNQVVGNGTYHYFGYSNDPSYSTRCVGSVFEDQLHFINPFHEYLTTTLMFSVQPNITYPSDAPVPLIDMSFLVFVEVNPSSGQIVSLQTQQLCD